MALSTDYRNVDGQMSHYSLEIKNPQIIWKITKAN